MFGNIPSFGGNSPFGGMSNGKNNGMPSFGGNSPFGSNSPNIPSGGMNNGMLSFGGNSNQVPGAMTKGNVNKQSQRKKKQ